MALVANSFGKGEVFSPVATSGNLIGCFNGFDVVRSIPAIGLTAMEDYDFNRVTSQRKLLVDPW